MKLEIEVTRAGPDPLPGTVLRRMKRQLSIPFWRRCCSRVRHARPASTYPVISRFPAKRRQRMGVHRGAGAAGRCCLRLLSTSRAIGEGIGQSLSRGLLVAVFYLAGFSAAGHLGVVSSGALR